MNFSSFSAELGGGRVRGRAVHVHEAARLPGRKDLDAHDLQRPEASAERRRQREVSFKLTSVLASLLLFLWLCQLIVTFYLL